MLCLVIVGGIRSSVVARWTAGQQVAIDLAPGAWFIKKWALAMVVPGSVYPYSAELWPKAQIISF